MRPLTKLLEGPNAERYLRYAMTRLEDLRRTGCAFMSDVSEVGDATIQVKILGERDYIRIVVGGIELFASGYVGKMVLTKYSSPSGVWEYSVLANDPEYAYVRSHGGGFSKIKTDEKEEKVFGSFDHKYRNHAVYAGSGYYVSLEVDRTPIPPLPPGQRMLKVHVRWAKGGKEIADVRASVILTFAYNDGSLNLNTGEPFFSVLGNIDAQETPDPEAPPPLHYIGIPCARLVNPADTFNTPSILVIASDGTYRFSDITGLPNYAIGEGFSYGMAYGRPALHSTESGHWIAGVIIDFSYGLSSQRHFAICTSTDKGQTWANRLVSEFNVGWFSAEMYNATFFTMNRNLITESRSGSIFFGLNGRVARTPNANWSSTSQLVTRVFRADGPDGPFVPINLHSLCSQDYQLRVECILALRDDVLFCKVSSNVYKTDLDHPLSWDGLFEGFPVEPTAPNYRDNLWWLVSKDDGKTWEHASMQGFPYPRRGARYCGMPMVTRSGKSSSEMLIPVFDLEEGLFYAYKSSDDGAKWAKWQMISGTEDLWYPADWYPENMWSTDGANRYVPMNNFGSLYLTKYRGKDAPFNIVTPWQTGEGKKPEQQT